MDIKTLSVIVKSVVCIWIVNRCKICILRILKILEATYNILGKDAVHHAHN